MADERAVRAAEKLTHRANGCEDIGGVLGGVCERRAATIAAEYADVLAENERLKQQVVHLTADAAETDQHIREAAKRVIPAHQVDGDSVCVPPLEEVVDAIVQQVAEQGRALYHMSDKLVEAIDAKHVVEVERARLGSQVLGLETLHAYIDDLLRDKQASEQQVAELRADSERWCGVKEVFDAMKGRDSVSKQFLLAKAEAAVVSGSR